MQITSISAPPDMIDLDPRNDEDFTELVKRNHRELLVYARALTRDEATARDIVQESFILAYDKITTFDVTRDFATWMRGIVRNKWREWVRRNKRYLLTDKEIAQIDADIAAWQARKANDENDLFESLRVCLHRLPGNLSAAIHVCYFEGRTGEEAATHLGIAPAALRKRLQRARVLLKECLDRKLSPTSSNS
ncbi:MAG: RNA polymerase sigma factor [Verrucomicrobiales bacterium]|nr:RNA polymerase sigma factor [Verrucomicrobiales bacterium]